MVSPENGGGATARPSGRPIWIGLGIVVVIGAIAALVRDEPEVAPTTTTTAPTAAETTLAPSEPSTQLAPLDCWDLLSADEMFIALGADENPDIIDGADGFSQAEVCRQTIALGENYFVEISPGGPSDFEEGRTLLGVTGEEVAGVGAGALWFGGEAAEGFGEYGVLVVNQQSEHGRIYMRIFLGRPDVDPDTQRQLAIGLAALALPRFPGVEIAQPTVEPEIINFPEPPPPDTSDISLEAFLFAQEAQGVWSFEEGLISMLSLLAEEVTADEVLGDTDLADSDGSMIMLLAARYLETGEDPVAKERIGELIDQLTFSDEELAQLDVRGTSQDLLVASVPMVAAPASGCGGTDVFDCIVIELLPDGLSLDFLLYVPIDDQTSWTRQFKDAVIQAVNDSNVKFKGLGTMPEDLRVFLLPDGERAYTSQGPDACGIYLGEAQARSSLGSGVQFRQRIAQYVAQCFLASALWDLVVETDSESWWFYAYAVYLSGYVYDDSNLEHVQLPPLLEKHELSAGLDIRLTLNWAFFEFLHYEMGVRETFALIKGLTPGNDGVEDLDGPIDLLETLHLFELGLTNADIRDLGGGFVPFRPQALEFVVIAPVRATLHVPPLGLSRVHIKVAEGHQACYSIERRGDNAYSLRPGAPGEALEWPELPDFLHGEMTFVVSAVDPSTELDIVIHEVAQDASCSEEPQETASAPSLACGECPPSQYFHEG